jgi:hypothetical protein
MKTRALVTAAAIALSLLVSSQPTYALAADAGASHLTRGRDIERAATGAGSAIKKGAERTAHFSEVGGIVLWRLLEHARPAPLVPFGTQPW